MNLGTRIVVLGVSACGKSTFARSLAEGTSLPLTHMDSIMWNPGWVYTNNDEAVARIRVIAAEDAWIVEGYIPKDARTLVLERADTIIYLDYPSHVSSWRYIMRWLKHRRSPRPELPGCPETFSLNFLHRVWAKREMKSLRPYLATRENQKKMIIFKRPKEAKIFVRNLS